MPLASPASVAPASPGADPGPPGERVPFSRRLAATTVVGWCGFAIYTAISHHRAADPAIVPMPGWVPFLPIFAAPYLAMLLVAWLLPAAVADRRRFRSCLRAMFVSFAMIASLWILVPTVLPRPPLPHGWQAGLYRWMAAVDPPRCAMPCGHGIGPIAGAWYVGLERPAWRWPLAAMVALGLASVAFVWQHRPIDILIGAAATLACIAAEELLSLRDRPI
jgi:hypothetical protein